MLEIHVCQVHRTRRSAPGESPVARDVEPVRRSMARSGRPNRSVASRSIKGASVCWTNRRETAERLVLAAFASTAAPTRSSPTG